MASSKLVYSVVWIPNKLSLFLKGMLICFHEYGSISCGLISLMCTMTFFAFYFDPLLYPFGFIIHQFYSLIQTLCSMKLASIFMSFKYFLNICIIPYFYSIEQEIQQPDVH